MKPSDLLLSVIDFFGILVPGAMLVFLHGDFLLRPLGLAVGALQTPREWIPVFFVAYALGHFLLGFSAWMNKPASRRLRKETTAYYHAVRGRLELPPKVSETHSNVFYSVFSFIRIHSPEAVSELERQAADYKLFRSLTLLFLLDVPLAAATGSLSLQRLGVALVIAGLAAYRFQWLFDWTYRMAFDFYLQLQNAGTARAGVS